VKLSKPCGKTGCEGDDVHFREAAEAEGFFVIAPGVRR